VDKILRRSCTCMHGCNATAGAAGCQGRRCARQPRTRARTGRPAPSHARALRSGPSPLESARCCAASELRRNMAQLLPAAHACRTQFGL